MSASQTLETPGQNTSGSSPRAYTILLLTDADVFAGTEKHILDLAQALVQEDVRPIIGCPVPSPLADRASAVGVEVVKIAKRGILDLAAIKSLRKMLRTNYIDVIHAHNG